MRGSILGLGLIVGSLGVPSAALAGTFYLESEASTNRDAAIQVAQALAAEGIEGEVMRLYVRDVGWRYVFRSEEAATAAPLEAVMRQVPRPGGMSVSLVAVEEGRASVVRAAAPAPAVSPAAPTPPVSPDRALEAQEIVRRVVRAHAGPASHGGLAAAPTLLFRFERELPGLRVVHVYARRGQDVYVEVDVVEGEGMSSRAGIVAGRAWTDVDGAAVLDPLFVKDVLRRFSPERVLGVAAMLTAGPPAGREYDEMSVGEAVRVNGRAAVVLEFNGDRETSPRSMVVDAGTWRLVEAVDADELRWRYEDWVDVGDGSIYPRRAEAWLADQVVDSIEVIDLDLQPVLPAEWFPAASR